MSLTKKTNESRMERKKAETKKKIIDVAIKLFKLNGVDAVTMEQIAAEVDIAKGTLYNYFPAKEAIIDEFIKRSFQGKNPERMAQLKNLPNTRTRMVLLFTYLIEGVGEHKELFEKYLVYRMQNMVSFQQDENEKSGFHLIATEIIKLGQEEGEIRNDLPFYTLVDLFEFVFIEIVKQFYMEPENFKSQEITERCVDLFLSGVTRRT